MDKVTLLVNYFENSLSKEERVLFDNLIANDIEFKQEFEFQQKVKTAITLETRKNLKQQLQQLEAKKKPQIKVNWYAFVASITLFVFAGYFYYNSLNNTSTLYKNYYETFPNIELPSERGSITNDVKTQAFAAYDNQEFKKAKDLFSILYKQNDEDTFLFYEGICLMELSQYKEAISVFNKYQDQKNNTYKYQTKWYLALCYLHQKEVTKTKELLTQITQIENVFQHQATALLEDLK